MFSALFPLSVSEQYCREKFAISEGSADVYLVVVYKKTRKDYGIVNDNDISIASVFNSPKKTASNARSRITVASRGILFLLINPVL